MYSKYREQDLKTPPDYRGFGLKRFHALFYCSLVYPVPSLYLQFHPEQTCADK